MRRLGRNLLRALAVIVAVPVMLICVLLIAGNTDPGRRFLERITPTATAGMVHIEGLGGRFLDRPRAERLTVADDLGVWLTITHATLDWSPTRLLGWDLAIASLEADDIAVARMPHSSGGSSTPLPRIDLSRLEVARLDLDASVAGQPLALTLRGAGSIGAADSATGHLVLTELPAGGQTAASYTLEAAITPAHWRASLAIIEGAHGLIAGLAGVPDLGPMMLTASVDGPRDALATTATLTAGELRGAADGTIDAVNQTANLSLSLVAPQMTIAPDVGWSSVRLEGKAHGPFLAPDVTATLAVDDVTAAGASVGTVRADLAGVAGGRTELHVSLDTIRLPGASPDLLAGTLQLDATSRLMDPGRPVNFSLRHPLFAADGDIQDLARGHATVTVANLAPLARMGQVDLDGQAKFDLDLAIAGETLSVGLQGGVGVTGGMPQAQMLVGGNGRVDLALVLKGEDATLTRFSLAGSGVAADASGTYTGGRLNGTWHLGLTDLAALHAGASGHVDAKGNVSGTLQSLTVAADLTGEAAASGGRIESVAAHVEASGLPDAPSGRLSAQGSLLGAPLALNVAAERQGDGYHFVIDQAAWKSLNGAGTLDVANWKTLPSGNIRLAMSDLGDLTPLIGRRLAGSVAASVESTSGGTRIAASADNATAPGLVALTKAELAASISGIGPDAAVDGTLTLDGIDAQGVRASGRVTAKGPEKAVAVALSASTRGPRAVPNDLAAQGLLDVDARSVSLTVLRAGWGKDVVSLLAPAHFRFSPAIAVDRLQLGFRQGELVLAGRWSPADDTLNGTANLRMPADIAAVFQPEAAMDGLITGEARLAGHLARPEGTVRVTATGLRARAGAGRGLPAANATFAANLNGASARVDARLAMGTANLTLSGLVPTAMAGPLDLSVHGTADLALVRPFVAAQGMDVRGQIAVAARIGGTPARPQPGGTVRLSNGAFEDAVIGTRITAIAAELRGATDAIQVVQLNGRAGEGTIGGSGTIRLGDNPAVDLSLRAANARLLANDLATARADAALTLRGPMKGTPALAGTITVQQADITVPEKLPPSIAVLPVREAGRPAPAPAKSSGSAAMPDIGLDVTLNAPARIYVRGRGLNAELGGRVSFTGTAAKPVPHGGLQLRRGNFALAGTSLNLTSGTIDFAGGGIANPQLHLVATSASAALIATLTVSGDVSSPKITLSSVPELPQDEILSQLLFNTTKTRLSPFQLAEMASALASLSGVDSPIGDPLANLRSKLGLDQLSVGSNAKGGATLEVGRYIAPNVRIGASQAAGGTGTQATVQVDLAKGLKLEATAGAANTADVAAGATNGTSVGLKYQFEY
jgi:translocation and assembly module TamB